MRFTFKAKDKKGEKRKGVIDAASKELAYQLLQENNLIPISIERETGSSDFNKYFQKSWERVEKKTYWFSFANSTP